MKFRAVCIECYKNEKDAFFSKEENSKLPYFVALDKYYFENEDKRGKDIYYETDVRDTPGFVLTCKYGHESFIYLEIEVYELLYDRGIFAYNDHYYREAIVNLASSVERFHEYCIRLMLYASRVKFEEVKETFKLLKYTERQYGSFVSLFTSTFKISPPKIGHIELKKLKKEWSNFRNDVVHNGYFPTRDETIQAINLTSKYMYEVLQYFKVDNSSFNKDALMNYKYTNIDIIIADLVKEYKELNGKEPEKIKEVDLTSVVVKPFVSYIFYKIGVDGIKKSEFHKYSEEQLEDMIKLFIEDNKDAYKK